MNMEKQLGWVGRESEKLGTETLWKHFAFVNKHPGNAPENLGTGKLAVILRMRKNYYIHTWLFCCRICTHWSLGGRELVSLWEKLQNCQYQKYGAWWKGRWWQITLFERYEESEDSPELQSDVKRRWHKSEGNGEKGIHLAARWKKAVTSTTDCRTMAAKLVWKEKPHITYTYSQCSGFQLWHQLVLQDRHK